MTQQTVGLFISAPFGSSLRGGEMEETTGSVKGPAVMDPVLRPLLRNQSLKKAASALDC